MIRTACQILVLTFLAVRAIAAPQIVEERWYLVELAGAKAGHMLERTERLDDGTLRVSSVMALAIARGPARVEVTVEAESIEEEDGEPISMRIEQRLGAALLSTDISFDGRTATIVESQFGQETPPRTVVVDADALMPSALAKELERRISAGEDRIVLSAFDPMSASVVESVYTRGERAVVNAAGRAAPATKWTVTQSVMPGVESAYFLDDAGEMVRGDVALGGITLTMLLTEKELALAENAPAELLVSTLVTPDRPITNPRTLESASYTLRTTASRMPDLPSWGTQMTERVDDTTLRVRVNLGEPGATATPEERAQALAPSAMLDADDPEVAALADRAAMELRGALLDDPFEVARACRRFVYSYIDEKSLDVGFATASEVARTRQGDCTEHAVLLAAILRARGIPSRVASGLIYVDEFVGEKGIFGFHMWTQALLPDRDGVERWVDLDATLPNNDFDAAHIGVAVSDLGGAERINTMAAVAPLLGMLNIEVNETVPAPTPDTMPE
jgi:hypothetical protein